MKGMIIIQPISQKYNFIQSQFEFFDATKLYQKLYQLLLKEQPYDLPKWGALVHRGRIKKLHHFQQLNFFLNDQNDLAYHPGPVFPPTVAPMASHL